MKIPTKDSTDKAKLKQRQLQIEEGLNLAKKIDLLRQTAQTEEENLRKFRVETTRIVQKEIDDLIIERDSLIQEIDELTSKSDIQQDKREAR